MKWKWQQMAVEPPFIPVRQAMAVIVDVRSGLPGSYFPETTKFSRWLHSRADPHCPRLQQDVINVMFDYRILVILQSH
jgi:hypothetical protein